MRVLWRLHPKRPEQRDMLRGIAQMILASDDVGNLHLQIIHHVHQMKHRLPIRPHNHKIRVRRFPVCQFPPHIAHHQIRYHNRLPRHLELDRPIRLIRKPFRQKPLHFIPINRDSLTLKIRPKLPLTFRSRLPSHRPLIPVQPQPAKSVQNHLHRLLRIARRVCVLDPQHECSPRVPRIKPIEQRRPRPAYVQETRRTRRKPNAYLHRLHFSLPPFSSPAPSTARCPGHCSG